MNFRTDNSLAKVNLHMIKTYTKQYLNNRLTDKAFKSLCLDEIQEIIDRDLELTGIKEWLFYLIAKTAKLFTNIFKKIRNGESK